MRPMSSAVDVRTEELAFAASQGDSDALGRLYETYADPLLRYLLTRTHNDLLLAEDLAGTTWERVAKGIRSYRTQGGGFVAWLFTIGRYAAFEHGRRVVRSRETLRGEMLALDKADPNADAPEDLVARRMQSHEVARAVNALPKDQRKCVLLRFYVGLSLKDTAAVMGRKTNAIKQLQFRALRSLGTKIDGSWAVERTAGTFVSAADMEATTAESKVKSP